MVRNGMNGKKSLTWRDRGLHRFQWGICRRNKIKTGTFSCNSIGGALDIQKVEIFNSRISTDDFNLDEISTRAIMSFIDLPTKERDHVLAVIKEIVTKDVDVFTGRPLGVKGITEKMAKQIVSHVKISSRNPGL
jgi:hypothetical protein